MVPAGDEFADSDCNPLGQSRLFARSRVQLSTVTDHCLTQQRLNETVGACTAASRWYCCCRTITKRKNAAYLGRVVLWLSVCYRCVLLESSTSGLITCHIMLRGC